MRISDWSSDVCSSDITLHHAATPRAMGVSPGRDAGARAAVGAAAMLAHEIKNPLSGIRGAAQLLEGGEGAADLTSLIVTEVDRIAAQIGRASWRERVCQYG